MNDEKELIAAAQSGDRDAFCQLARQYQRRIYALALHYTRDAHNAEDLSQEVWLKAYRALALYRGEAGFYTWLRQITINTLLNHQRTRMFSLFSTKSAAQNISLTDSDFDLPVEPGQHQRLLVQQVLQALGELSARERLIFLLKHQEGMTYDEIALACNVSSGTIKKALFRTVTKLRQQLGVNQETVEVPQLLPNEKS